MFLCCENASGGENFGKFMEVAALDDDYDGYVWWCLHYKDEMYDVTIAAIYIYIYYNML